MERKYERQRALAEFSAHYHGERNHQGKDNKLLFPDARDTLFNVATASEASSSIMAAPHE
jgi:hypothetical protein